MANHSGTPLVAATALFLVLGSGSLPAQSVQPGIAGEAAGQNEERDPGAREPAMTLIQPLLDATAGELGNRALLNADRERIGSVEMIARDRSDNTVNAVVRVGGWFGFGGTLVVVPMDRLYPRGNSLILFEPLTEAQLRGMPKYREDRHEVIAGDTRLGDLEGIEPSPQPPRVTFDDMDRDNDGYIQPIEAQSQLLQDWDEYDRNGDNRIDRGEFSAFQEKNIGPVPEV